MNTSFFLFLIQNSVGRNRYSFKGKSKYAVFGDMLGLRLSYGLGKMKEVENLTKSIEIVIPNKTPHPEPLQYQGYCTLMRNIHLLPCQVNESVLILQVKPHIETVKGKNVNLFVFMNKGKY